MRNLNQLKEVLKEGVTVELRSFERVYKDGRKEDLHHPSLKKGRKIVKTQSRRVQYEDGCWMDLDYASNFNFLNENTFQYIMEGLVIGETPVMEVLTYIIY